METHPAMPLSPEDKKRIEEEEYRRAVRAEMERRVSAEIDLRSTTRVETHGVAREIYRDWKTGMRGCVGLVAAIFLTIVVVVVIYGVLNEGWFAATP